MKQNKKIKRLSIFIVILTLLVLAAAGTAVYLKMTLNDTQDVLASAQEEMQANKKIVYVVSTDDGFGISKGEILQENVNVKKQHLKSTSGK